MWYIFDDLWVDKQESGQQSGKLNGRVCKTISKKLYFEACRLFKVATIEDDGAIVSGKKDIPKINKAAGILTDSQYVIDLPNGFTTEDILEDPNESMRNDIFDSRFHNKHTGEKLVLLLQQAVETHLQYTGFSSSNEALKAYVVDYVVNIFKDDPLALNEIKYSFPPNSGSAIPIWLMIEFIKIVNFQWALTVNFTQSLETLNKLREQGNNLMANMCFAQAIKQYTKAIEHHPTMFVSELPQLFTNRAIAFIGLNCVPEAIDDLNMALRLDRSFTPAWTQLGYCHMYMGHGLIALQCYLCSLKSSVGEILPPYLTSDKSELIEEYRNNKCRTILPQFIERLNQAIALTEKRAYQQLEYEEDIRKVVQEVRRILARLRAQGPEDDREYFSYLPLYRDSNLRTMSERANSNRPNILTPEVQQNMMARNGMETATVTQVRTEPLNTTTTTTTIPTTLNTASTTSGNNSTANTPPGVDNRSPRPVIRDLLNDLGSMFDNQGREGTDRGINNSTAQNSDNPAQLFTDSLTEGIGGVISEGVRGMLGAFANNNPNARVFVQEFGTRVQNRTSSNTTANSTTNSATNASSRSNGDTDVDMREPPSDLD
ncbi:uncharacterized protein SPAPADRAFT_63124 [Spathaspora passalidarum NRRL Y-27907]|uniref:Uncharacterized protein n=1 Tax=Spathaspora passalidarum (strain NRRL Y-27907 / 11-Y1) TaxID=619300 RepID=G3ATQ0_SPAPN|nr:uncharacterized protein SPAPADRAFT_63124 [Spathaspora passalidarum NRRL Y-27907]EGW30276.1 hypothetical protein SPAPADRAFT_63124 [Spathaspora passalidarum NRRL Y-27907]